ncbi:MAG: hypothetical protein B6229_00920 [Spirochaetaceae bacterium 4572_7]|nr:MAG: hypothetical protein B6229_00920 [Spirochaetaceae bacterium 4572_7]
MMKLRNTLLNVDTSLCLKMNNLNGRKFIDKTSFLISKLGDGSIYFILITIFILLYNKPFIGTFKDYIITASLNLILYKFLKSKIHRERPFVANNNISKLIAPPDEFSFPSGHSGAAAVFMVCTFYHFPSYLGFFALIWMVLIGLSRVYNGVHYPSDVLMGFITGSVISKTYLHFIY